MATGNPFELLLQRPAERDAKKITLRNSLTEGIFNGREIHEGSLDRKSRATLAASLLEALFNERRPDVVCLRRTARVVPDATAKRPKPATHQR
jgi:hypothetical protein